MAKDGWNKNPAGRPTQFQIAFQRLCRLTFLIINDARREGRECSECSEAISFLDQLQQMSGKADEVHRLAQKVSLPGISVADIIATFGVSKSTAYRKIDENGLMPISCEFGDRSDRYDVEDVKGVFGSSQTPAAANQIA